MSDLINYHLVYPDPRESEVNPTGGYVEVHTTHHNHEAARNIETAKLLAKLGYKVRLLQIDTTPHHKNPDAYFLDEEIEVEFKHNLTPTRSAIEEAIRKGRHQADYLVIHILSEVSTADLKSVIIGRMKFAYNVRKLWIIRDQQLVTLTREEIYDGTIALKIQ
ncbi:hypothetical protein J2I47_13185 [Fibrella sp. HMF5335]|uniref:tRNA nuclease CdiA C-terminal domain-containing protein n=1 Tax=Fibrella rubiginis TaxID=2817060 RepID=A0A939GEH7_9BACT|nr:hypothetical protein [Fibrella rubiginis]MBO0937504.1 hypothetical protein [Fibrella rubiginis]